MTILQQGSTFSSYLTKDKCSLSESLMGQWVSYRGLSYRDTTEEEGTHNTQALPVTIFRPCDGRYGDTSARFDVQ